MGGSIVGFDFSGVIKQVGSKVENLNIGDEIYGFAKVRSMLGKQSLRSIDIAGQFVSNCRGELFRNCKEIFETVLC